MVDGGVKQMNVNKPATLKKKKKKKKNRILPIRTMPIRHES